MSGEPRVEHHMIDNGDGWRLALRRVAPSWDADGSSAPRPRPLLIVPGYGMNSFIFGFHPKGLSLEAYFASRGIETWCVDLRAQGRSERAGGTDRFGLGDLAITDVGCAILGVLERTRTGHDELDLIGASLGASLVFAHLAWNEHAPVHSIVSFGGLVTWVKVPPLLRAAFFSPGLVGRLQLSNTRRLAGFVLPTLARWAPGLLSMYMHTASTDVAEHATMVKTVEDPNPHVNREIAEWIATRELIVRGKNVSRALASMKHPLLTVVALQDGIVPPETARSPHEAMGSSDKELLEVGDLSLPLAHADLFLSTGAQEKIFAKVADFLLRHAAGGQPDSSS